MNLSEETIIFILSQIYKVKKDNLSQIELFKLLYLIETESYRYTGDSFFNEEVLFTRDKNGPISVDVYKALDNLSDFVQKKERKKPDYPYKRHSFYIKEGVKYELKRLRQDQKLFINSVLLSFGGLAINKLKEKAYETEPMLDMISKEQKRGVECFKGASLNFKTVKLDKDMKEIYG